MMNANVWVDHSDGITQSFRVFIDNELFYDCWVWLSISGSYCWKLFRNNKTLWDLGSLMCVTKQEAILASISALHLEFTKTSVEFIKQSLILSGEREQEGAYMSVEK